MNDLFIAWGISSWKPVLTAFILPPVPFLLLVLAGGWAMSRRRGLGWGLLLAGVAGVWLSACEGAADWLEATVLETPPPLSRAQVDTLRQRVRGGAPVGIIVLGGGRESLASEFGYANLTGWSIARLRYGAWLSRETGAPLGYSGGVGWGGHGKGPTEADTAVRIARDELGRPLRWAERESRDTRENAQRSVQLLKRDGIREVVLVSHAWHLPRGLRAFREAAGDSMTITPAPTGLSGSPVQRSVLEWLPSRGGFSHMQVVLHEVIGLLAGA